MQVRETNLRGLLGGERLFRVPIFQRRYAWTSHELAQLWSDVQGQYQELASDPPGSTHFLGSFVLMPEAAAFTRPVPSAILVDGQQRLLSALLLLVAIRDVVARTEPSARDRFDELYLRNRWQSGEDALRMALTPPDQPSFTAIVDGVTTPDDLIGKAYTYFRDQLASGSDRGDPLDLERLTKAVVERLAIVDITTDPGDNPHRIFESINATGKGLTQADLLRNYVFMRLPHAGTKLYLDTWRPMEDAIGVDNLEPLARLDLQCRGLDVAMDDVFQQQRIRLEVVKDEAGVTTEVADLARRAVLYRWLMAPEIAKPEVRPSLTRLKRWGSESAHPLLLRLLERFEAGQDDASTTIRAMSHIESYLVRRQLVGLATTGLTRLFIRIGQDLALAADGAAAVEIGLLDDPAYWPTDGEVRDAVRARPFYVIGRPGQRRLVLERLEESYGAAEPVDLEKAELTIEHIMPQTLSPGWRSHLDGLGDDPDEVHSALLHTLGNLTLTAFNGTLSNLPMERKRQIFAASNLALNTALKEAPSWGSKQILARADELAGRIIDVWQGPRKKRSASASTFESPMYWRPLERLIARLPKGRWATYEDLAIVAGTSPSWVRRHLRNVSGLEGSHRVVGETGLTALSSEVLLRLRAEGCVTKDEALDSSRRLSLPEIEDLEGAP